MMPRQPEGKLVVKIKKVVEARGGRCFKIQGSDDSFQEIGIPDLLCCFRGVFVGAEIKLPGSDLRPAQRAVLYEIFYAGGVAAVIDTVRQAERLFAYLEDWRPYEGPGLCFDRGVFRSAFKFD